MQIPPAHAIADMDMHVAVLLPSPPSSLAGHDVSPIRSASSVSVRSLPVQSGNGMPRSYVAEEQRYGMRRHVLSRRITEEEVDQTYQNVLSSGLENESGSEDGDNLMTVENPRFVKGKKGRQYHTEKPPFQQERRKSLFGSLRGFFGHHPKNETDDQHQSTNGGLTGLFGGKKNKWDMRAERNLRKMDMEDDKQLRGVARLNSPPRSAERPRRATGVTGSRGSLRFVNGNVVTNRDTAVVESDNESRRRKLTKGRGTGPLTRKRSSSMPPVTSPSRYAEDAEIKQRLVSVTAPPAQTASRPPPPTGALSRSSSIATAASAPVVSKMAGTKPVKNPAQLERRASMGNKSIGGKKGGSGSERVAGHVRSGSNPVSSSDGQKGEPSLWGIDKHLSVITRYLTLHAIQRCNCKYLADEYCRGRCAGKQECNPEVERKEESFYGESSPGSAGIRRICDVARFLYFDASPWSRERHFRPCCFSIRFW